MMSLLIVAEVSAISSNILKLNHKWKTRGHLCTLQAFNGSVEAITSIASVVMD